MVVVVLQHQATRCRAGDDIDVFRESAEAPDVLDPIFARQVHVGIDDRGNAAALLFGDDHLDAVAFEHGDYLLAQAAVVVIDPAAVEVGHRPAGLDRARMAFEPAFEGQPLVAGERTLAMDPDDPLHQQPHKWIVVTEVRERRGQAAEAAEQSSAAEHPITECATLLLGALVLCPPDVLLDRDLRWTGHLAQFATGAEVEPGGDGRLVWVAIAL